MKQKDIALIAIIVFISAALSFFVSKSLFSNNKPENKQAEVISVITADFPAPDSKYFNAQSVDPTKSITIQQNANTDPFNAVTKTSN